MTRKMLTILVPVYNEALNIDPLFEALGPVLAQLEQTHDVELLFTDNHSEDDTFARLQERGRSDPRVRVLRFSRNFGFQRSILCGYLNARGDAAIQIDCDLQDPPALIVQFVQRWMQGAKVVYGVRRSRKEGWLITWLRRVFYRLIDRLSDTRLPLDAGDFRLVDRCVIDELGRMEDYHPYLRGAIAAMGFEQVGIAYDRSERQHGESKFPLSKLVALAIDGILNHSVVPLRLATYTGLVVSVATLVMLVATVVGRLLYGGAWPAGFATLTVLILLSLSLNALFLGVIGEYLGRIYQQVKRRSLTIVEARVNDPPPPRS